MIDNPEQSARTDEDDAWNGHALVGPPGDKRCLKDDERPGSDDDPQAWFASHLEAAGGADYAVTFERDWRELVTDEHDFDLDKVARELADYTLVMEEASTVYYELAGFSKPNTAAVHVIEHAERRFAEQYADYLCRRIAAFDAENSWPVGRDEWIAIAEEWSEGAWDRYREARPA